MDFVTSMYFDRNEPLTSWTLLSPNFFQISADLEKNGGQKCSTGQRFISIEVCTSYKIHNLEKKHGKNVLGGKKNFTPCQYSMYYSPDCPIDLISTIWLFKISSGLNSLLLCTSTFEQLKKWHQFWVFCKVRIFWEGHKSLRNLHLTFDCMFCSQKLGEDFAKLCGLLRIHEL